jgi:hypothetical protein
MGAAFGPPYPRKEEAMFQEDISVVHEIAHKIAKEEIGAHWESVKAEMAKQVAPGIIKAAPVAKVKPAVKAKPVAKAAPAVNAKPEVKESPEPQKGDEKK